MVGPARPQFVLFGSSIVQLGFMQEGWGADLAHNYARKADVFMRGYAGWNSKQALDVVKEIFPKNDPVKPTLVICYFGGNDSVLPNPDNPTSHVPLPEYIQNMTIIATHLKSLSDTIRLIFLTAPPVNEEQIKEHYGHEDRTNVECKKYSDACLTLCKDMGITAIDMFTLIQSRPEWFTTSFFDGIHFTPEASKTVAEEIEKTIKEANWVPSLHWEDMPTEYDIPIAASALG